MGYMPIFYWRRKVSTRIEQLQTLLAPVIESLGYQCWGVEFISQGKHSLLRVFIDRQNHECTGDEKSVDINHDDGTELIERESGIGIEDCQKVTEQISAVLDVEDPIPYEYTLEVSSPGLDRPLYTLEQFEQFKDNYVKIKLRAPFEGKRNFTGLLQGIEDQHIVLRVDKEEYLLPIELIDKANVEPTFD